MKAWCMKCRGEKEIRDPVSVQMKTGSIATKGYCSVCGTRVCSIGKAYQPAAVTARPLKAGSILPGYI